LLASLPFLLWRCGRLCVAVEAAVGASKIAADVEAVGAAAEVALAAGAVGAAGLPGGVKLGKEIAVYAALDREAGLAAGLEAKAEALGEGRELADEVPLGCGVVLLDLNAGGCEAADHLAVESDEGDVNDGHSGACDGLGESAEEIEVKIGDYRVVAGRRQAPFALRASGRKAPAEQRRARARPLHRNGRGGAETPPHSGGDEGVVSPVEAARIAEIGDDIVEESELVAGGRHVRLQEGASEAGDRPVDENLPHA
jgi:hypothetical protein